MNRMFARCLSACLICLWMTSCATRAPEPLSGLQAPQTLVSGDDAKLTLQSLEPGEVVTLHALRLARTTEDVNGQPVAKDVRTHAWATFKADGQGRVDVSRASPLAGTYEGADANGLWWSGYRTDKPHPPSPWPFKTMNDGPTSSQEVVLHLQRKDRLVQQSRVQIIGHDSTVAIVPMPSPSPSPSTTDAAPLVAGVFAYPTGASRSPTLIVLHGSEGYDPASAQRLAARMAQRGFATLALAYVAYPWSGGGVAGVSPTFINVPIEILDRARQWLATRPEADTQRLGLYGISKGAEMSLVAATRYAWIKSVVACVPSDVVWAGFGGPPPTGVEASSWSWQGTPLPAIPYDRYDDVFARRATAEQVHRRSRAAINVNQLERVRIPVEGITAPVLLIGGGKDEVWPSLEMADAVVETMRRKGRSPRVEAVRVPLGGHGLCGTGTALTRLDDALHPVEQARGNGQAWQATIDFLRSTLR
jgi:dienelactone hydrolase